MSIKIIALGNLLMGDDGIAVYLAKMLEEEMVYLGFEIICAETDVGYLLGGIHTDDYLILLDATTQLPCGALQEYPIHGGKVCPTGILQHDYSLLTLFELYFPEVTGALIGIGIAELGYHYGLSQQLSERLVDLSNDLKHRLLLLRDRITSI